MTGAREGNTDKVAGPGQPLPEPEAWCAHSTIRPAKARQLQPGDYGVLWL